MRRDPRRGVAAHLKDVRHYYTYLYADFITIALQAVYLDILKIKN